MAGLSTFTFVPFFSAKKQACGPEGRALRVKSIGGKRKPSEDLIVLPQSQAGPSGARRAHLQRNNPVIEGRRACPPDPRNEKRLMVFARNALAFGPGNA
jgi:hypothetical protein